MKPFLILLNLFIGICLAQTGSEPYSIGKESKVIVAKHTNNTPKIDGFINESIWEIAEPFSDFVQEEPENGGMPSQKTEIRILFNNDYLFIAAILSDKEPEKIQGQLGLKDDWDGCFEEQSDWFSIDIDSRHDHQTAFSFSINSSGILADASVSDDSIYDLDWDAVWQAEVSLSDKGWYVEAAIPFSMLRFNAPKDNKMRWGINFTRYIHRKNEYINWVVFPLELHGIVSKYGHLDGLYGIYPPAKLQLTPYITRKTIYRRDVELYQTKVDTIIDGIPYDKIDGMLSESTQCYDLCSPYRHQNNFFDQNDIHFGFDVKYRISNNSIFDFSFNPDFAQVELDPSEVNLTVYETKLDEKRAFFKENTNFFQTPIEIFYSRRVGQESWVESARNGVKYWDLIPSIIKGASKLTGKTKFGFSYGFLTATTTLDDPNLDLKDKLLSSKNRNYNLFRFTQDVLSGNSYIGTTFSNFNEKKYSKSFGSIDYRLNLLGNKIIIEGQNVSEFDCFGFCTGKNNGNLFQLDANFKEFKVEFISENYDKNLDINDMGYLWRDDFKSLEMKIGYNKRNNKRSIFSIENPFVSRYALSLTANQSKNGVGLLIDDNRVINAVVVFKNYWKIWMQLASYGEHFNDRLIVEDYEKNKFGAPILIPKIEGYSFGISSSQLNPVVVKYSRQFYSNSRKDIMSSNEYYLSLNPFSSFRMELVYENDRLINSEHFIELVEENSKIYSVFSRLSNKVNIVTIRSSYTIMKNLVVDYYAEYFKNHDMYTNYFDPILASNEPEELYYSDNVEIESYLDDLIDPNIYPYYFSKLSSIKMNVRFKWEFSRGSNFYFVLTNTKEINGAEDLTFSKLFKYNVIDDPWTEKYRNMHIILKFNYWLNL